MTLFDLSDPLVIGFDVGDAGRPRPQGSMRAIRDRAGNCRMVEGGDDQSKAKLRAWRKAVKTAARTWRETHPTFSPLTGPVQVRLSFRLARPKSHPRHVRTWPISKQTGDIDKLERAILDALTGELFVDDAQVVGVVKTKDWGDPPGCEVRLRAL